MAKPFTCRSRLARPLLAALACLSMVAFWPVEASAQRRGRPARGGRSAVIVAAPVYYGYGYYDPFWWGYPGWYPYGWGAPHYGRGFYGARYGSARLQVKPRNAEVYVDGYLAGTVDNFDGFLQRLEVPPGEHELTFYLSGYKTVRQKIHFQPGATIKITHVMEPLAPGEAGELRPEPAPGASAAFPAPTPASDFGTLAIRVQPRDATIVIDGEEWAASEGAGPMRVDLAEGPHEIEVRRDGFATYRRTVSMRAGETVALNVSLTR